jgi:hypothetical protein
VQLRSPSERHIATRSKTLALLALSLALALPGQAATDWFGDFVARVEHQGADAQFPPHLAVVFGRAASDVGEPIKQAVVKAAPLVRTFNVLTRKPEAVVLLTFNEASRKTVAYLLTPSGTFRKAVTYEAGAQPERLPAAAAHTGLDAELSFWKGVAQR